MVSAPLSVYLGCATYLAAHHNQHLFRKSPFEKIIQEGAKGLV